METKTMDINERIALDLEYAQTQRYIQNFLDNVSQPWPVIEGIFWTEMERAIFERIKSFRYMSMTYTKPNQQ